MEILGTLLGDKFNVRVIRLFLFNPETSYTVGDVSLRTAVIKRRVQTILARLLKAGLVRKKIVSREIKRDKKKKTVYYLDQKFPYAATLYELLADASIHVDNRLVAKLMPAGKIKLIIAGGVFVRKNDARLDLLIVGDDIGEDRLARIIQSLETDIGRDLSYSSLATTDFQYRLGLHDRLIRDIIDFNHVILVDKIGFRAHK